MHAISYQILLKQHFDQEGALQFMQATVDELRDEIGKRSYDLEFMTKVIKLFIKIAVYEKKYIPLTEALINKCMRINPEYQWLHMVMADVFILKEDYESAFTTVKKVVDQDQGSVEKQLKLASVAIYSSRDDVVKQALENIKKIRISLDKNITSKKKSFLTLGELYQLAKVYGEMKHYAVALQYLNEILTIVSEEKMYFDQDSMYYARRKKRNIAQIHVDIAEIYLKLNDRAATIREAENAVKIYPGFSDNVKLLIESINK